MVTVKEAFPGVEGFGASFNGEEDAWVIYTMPTCQAIGTVKGFDSNRIDWILDVLRAAHKSEVEQGQKSAS